MSPVHATLAAMAYLLAKHAVADFFLQTETIYRQKGIYGAPGGLLHALIHILLTAPVFLLFPGGSATLACWLLAAEFLVHYHIDWAKEQIVRHYGWRFAEGNLVRARLRPAPAWADLRRHSLDLAAPGLNPARPLPSPATAMLASCGAPGASAICGEADGRRT